MGWSFNIDIDAGGSHPINYDQNINYTHNTTKMLFDVGIDIYKIDGKPASEVRSIFAIGLKKLEADPSKYKAMNPDNGWGSYSGLLEVMQKVIDSCDEAPKGIARVWA